MTSTMSYKSVPVSTVVIADGFNVRTAEEVKDGIDTLVASINHIGLKTPIVVKPLKGGRYQVINGHRRLTAINLINEERPDTWVNIPVLIAKDLSDEAAIEMMLGDAESKPLSAMALAEAVERLSKFGGLSAAQIAEKIGKSEVYVGKLRTLAAVVKSEPEIKDLITSGAVAPTEVIKVATEEKRNAEGDITEAAKATATRVKAGIKAAKESGKGKATAKTLTPVSPEPKPVPRSTMKDVLESAVTTIDNAVAELDAGNAVDVSSLRYVLEEAFRVGVKAFNNRANLDYQRLRIEYGDSMGK